MEEDVLDLSLYRVFLAEEEEKTLELPLVTQPGAVQVTFRNTTGHPLRLRLSASVATTGPLQGVGDTP